MDLTTLSFIMYFTEEEKRKTKENHAVFKTATVLILICVIGLSWGINGFLLEVRDNFDLPISNKRIGYISIGMAILSPYVIWRILTGGFISDMKFIL